MDALAELYSHGIIDRTGRFSHECAIPRLKKTDEGMQFQLIEREKIPQEIVITQMDIDNLIRSKAGIFSAIHVLLDSTQTNPDDLDAVYLAGGFGNFLDTRQAIVIGMLPDIPLDKIHFVGNTTIEGAKKVALHRASFKTTEQIAQRMTYFDLMSHPGYMEEFIRAKFLPHTDLSLFPTVGTRSALS